MGQRNRHGSKFVEDLSVGRRVDPNRIPSHRADRGEVWALY
jgi:hypothetical protein